MTTNDGFRLIPADRAEKTPEPPVSATAWRREMIKAGVLGATAAAIALAVISFETPRALVTNATAFLASLSPHQDGKVEPVPAAQSSADIQSSAAVQASAETQASPPTASEPVTSAPAASEATPVESKVSEKASEPTADSNAAAPAKTADQSRPDTAQVSAEDLLGRFQAWAARDNPKADAPAAQPAPEQPAAAAPAQDTAQATPAKPDPAADPGPTQDARAEIETAPGHRAVRRVKHVRAEIRSKRDQEEDYKQAQKQAHRAKLRREQEARVRNQRAQDIREPERPVVQNTRSPSFLESIGLREY